ncbi:MAG TPA: ribonuclease Z [Candidatus Cloacimonadota bacterium]|jgi:ribonuclease Z|nr:ribonuclease Z [Candidatus Cloacimonadales bacterium]HPY96634.1 ribonuclease Z [Candidatus Cloacimonadota bacterium]HQB41693.1 ribonuclease Z [Candidatus Cloacimonadota bacterium]
MKFIVLGSSSGLADKGKNLSSFYVHSNNKHILIDTGEGIAHQVQAEHLDHDVLDAVFISHFHPDHVTGFFMLIQVLFIQGRKKKLQVFLPEKVDEFAQMLEFFYTFRKKIGFAIDFHHLSETEKYYPFIKVQKNDHLRSYRKFLQENNCNNGMVAYSFRITENDKSIVFTSDINTVTSILDLLNGCDYCIADAFHPTIKELKLLAEHTKEKTILTHGSTPETDILVKENDKYIYAEENKVFSI